MDSKLAEQWRKAVESAGGLEEFEKKILPSCSDAVKVCWNKIVKAELNEVKA
jgi:hypothetical protein